jgi:hypothetical protein
MAKDGDEATASALARLSTTSLMLLAERLEEELQDVPIYRDLLVIRKLLADRQKVPAHIISMVKPPNADLPYAGRAVRMGRITSIGAATKALQEAGRPMTIHELVEAVQRLGFEFVGTAKKPARALAVYLNKPKGKSPIVSIWIDNKPHWWFRDQPVPGAKIA